MTMFTDHHQLQRDASLPTAEGSTLREKSKAEDVKEKASSRASHHTVVLPAGQGRAWQLLNVNRKRKRALILPPSADIILGSREAVDALANSGAVIATAPNACTYLSHTLTVPLEITSEDALWAIAASNVTTPAISVIEESWSGGPTVD